ncbi:glycosyltransferase [Paraconexibacter antarcticus]|uniref:Glycosyltransferase n=1 Tax=Paraconexibacter antarcticus TaxID=2949664 RepID=A0ABY5DZK6_9ACTN|nr:glycosyltransferase [Paraconexibacter antarcticus]UTI66646.1 glycosyltransferase [Paraconexibacter antarcticus]
MARLIAVEDLVGPSVLGRGGHAMHVLQILEGLRRLGHDVLFLEYFEEPPTPEAVATFHTLVDGWWDPERAALLDAATGESHVGLSSSAVADFAARADGLLSLAAHYRAEPWPLLEDVRPRLLIEQDPGYTHLWAEDGEPVTIFGEHDVYFTVGMNVGTERSAIPTCGIDWHPLWPPVIPDWWPTGVPVVTDAFTTIAAWRDYGYLDFRGETLGPKVDEFERFLDLPQLASETIELALAIEDDDPDRPRLLERGWRLTDPAIVSTPERYRDYVAGSLGEFSCAKGGYVGTRSGWFSDRSACYLAAGRPVVLQSTGVEELLPTGLGIITVTTPEEAAAALRAVRGDYARHATAARELARTHFDAERLLAGALELAGLPRQGSG